MFRHCDTCDVECGNRKYSQNAENQKRSIWKSLREVLCWAFHEREAWLSKDTCINSKRAWDKGQDWQQSEIDNQAKKSFVSNDLKGIKMIFWKELLLKNKKEPIEEERNADQNVTHNLETLCKCRITWEAALPESSAKAKLEKPTMKTPMKARAHPAYWCLYILALRKKTDKTVVVMIVPPLNIW